MRSPGAQGPPRAGLPTAALALAVTTVLAGCATDHGDPVAGQSTDVPDEPVTITWQAAPFGNRGDDARVWLVEEFERLHPTIEVEVVSAPTNVDTNRAGLSTQIMGGSSDPDIYNGDVAWSAQMADAGLALPVDEYLPDDYFDGFDPAVVEAASYEGRTYGIPLTLDQSFLYYRADLLGEHGLEPPTTWEEVAEQSRLLVDEGEVDHGLAYQGAAYEGLTAVTNEFAAAAGGGILDEGLETPAIDDAPAHEAVEFMHGLGEEGLTPAGVSTFEEPESLQSFTNGQSAFLRNWAYAHATAEDPEMSEIAGDVGVTAMPAFEGRDTRASTVGGWNVYMNPHTENLGASLAFLTWITSPEIQAEMAERSSTVPTLDAVRESEEIRALSPVIAAAPDNDLVSRPTSTPHYTQVSQAVFSNVNAVLSGTEETGDALGEARGAVQSALDGRSL